MSLSVYDNPWGFTHAQDPTQDYTLCGLSQDGVLFSNDVRDGEALPMVKIGDLVTCINCKKMIMHCKNNFKRNRRVE